ncbi:hypothetical protein RB653_002909 [Dictyostelium firmibasis]|uniref:Arylamine N-acetyltransferase n=1 Tax=Dictyostelium firmibasis TaxID=79012 RepID=A0AAN7TY87_9MYCE
MDYLNNDMNNEIFSYEKLSKGNKYNIKELLLHKLKLNKEFEIKTLDDIAFLQKTFVERLPYNNFDLCHGIDEWGLDYIVKRLLIDGEGGICTTLNILMGMFLHEFNIPVKLIKAHKQSQFNVIPHFSCHISNIFQWPLNNKWYMVEVGIGFFGSLNPIELGNEIGILSNAGNQSYYRCIEIPEDGSYIYQEKKPGTDSFFPLFQFNTKEITHGEILDCHQRYLEITEKKLFSFLKFETGYYYFHHDCLKVGFLDGKENTITITDQYQLKKMLLNYFNINLNVNVNVNVKKLV